MLAEWRLRLSAGVVGTMAILFVGCAQSGQRGSQPGASGLARIILYCGGGVRAPVTECLRDFERQSGVQVEAIFGPSPRMFDEVRRQHGDVYLAGDIHFIQVAEQQGDVLARQTVCYVVPVIVVSRGNPKKISRISDLGRPGVHFYLIDAKQCQQGLLGERLLAQHGVDVKTVRANRLSELPAGRDIVSMLAAGELDAAILWERGARSLDDRAEVVTSPELTQAACPVAAIILRWCRNRPAADRLLEYLANPVAQRIFRQHGFGLEPPPTSAVGSAEGSAQE